MTDVIVVGFDGSPEVMDSIRAGEIDATVCSRLPTSPKSLSIWRTATSRQANCPVKKKSIDCILITPENVDEYGVFAPVAQ